MLNSSEDLIKILKEKREKLKISQNKLAKKIDVAHTSIARIENGTINPTLAIFISMANELGYDLKFTQIDENEKNKINF